ncbi:MAG: MATE family efflux transporter [Ancrocorticia sp.]|uniref:MATE family efflux transporter n=1 Tax=Ancrocorticia sp. TaxID=2593684 RepID=UPI003F8E14F0
MTNHHQIDRDIRRLALPSLGSLLAEPLLIAVDSIMVGRLGTVPLAGLSLASTILTTLVGLCIFLAYATTGATARLFGAGKAKQAFRQGIDGMWLAVGLGIILMVLLTIFARPFLGLFGPEGDVLEEAVRYLRSSAFGLPGMLLVLAATGTLRGMGDTKTPLYAATAGAIANIPLNFVLIYPAGLGIFGAGLGTAIAQTGMGIWLASVVIRSGRKAGASFLPSGAGVLRSLRDAGPLIIRTVSLRAAILLQITAATGLGTEALASNQITMTVWNFAAYGLDALATSAQILVGQGLGSADRARVKTVLGRCLNRGFVYGAGLGVIIFGLSWFLPTLVSEDPAVRTLATQSLWIAALAIPIASVAYMLDGVLIGAGDTNKLALYMVISLAAFTPAALAVMAWGSGRAGLLALWGAYAVLFMAARGGTMLLRVRGDKWMKLGDHR